MQLLTTIAILTLTNTIVTVFAWGSLGHRTTTALSLLYIPPFHPAHTLLSTLLHDQDPTTAALFPDRIRYIPSFAYSAPWHYIDAQDNPPLSCSIDFARDCLPESGGCVVSAIANHTDRVRDASLPLWQRGQSLRFMLHFFGDVHQPLHTENLSRGGNEIAVVFDGVRTNLHSVWDTLMPVKMALLAEEVEMESVVESVKGKGKMKLENETEAAYAWAEFLYARYDDDERVGEKVDDVCVDDALDCSLDWARESNMWVCEYVLRDGVDALQQRDLGAEYFEGAASIIEEMIVKGGRRLAKWLMLIAEEVDEDLTKFESYGQEFMEELK